MKHFLFICLFVTGLPAAAHAAEGTISMHAGVALLFHVIANVFVLRKIWLHNADATGWKIAWSAVSLVAFIIGPILFVGLANMPSPAGDSLPSGAGGGADTTGLLSPVTFGAGAEGLPKLARVINGELEPGEESPHSKLAAEARMQARTGDAKAQNHYGTVLEFGDGTDMNCAGAARWYRRAADQGYAPAQASLAELYYRGHGVDKSLDEALFWMTLAAAGDRRHEPRRSEFESFMTKDAVRTVSARVRGWSPVVHVSEKPFGTA